jgi:hypothetical protein
MQIAGQTIVFTNYIDNWKGLIPEIFIHHDIFLEPEKGKKDGRALLDKFSPVIDGIIQRQKLLLKKEMYTQSVTLIFDLKSAKRVKRLSMIAQMDELNIICIDHTKTPVGSIVLPAEWIKMVETIAAPIELPQDPPTLIVRAVNMRLLMERDGNPLWDIGYSK